MTSGSGNVVQGAVPTGFDGLDVSLLSFEEDRSSVDSDDG
jgi:hypothetical protein